jgi:hypothetical protein
LRINPVYKNSTIAFFTVHYLVFFFAYLEATFLEVALLGFEASDNFFSTVDVTAFATRPNAGSFLLA